jgi:hypothetical protein
MNQLGRGIVWCMVCGKSRQVNSSECLRAGWPMCCNYTMTIDSPAERYAKNRKRDEHGRFCK